MKDIICFEVNDWDEYPTFFNDWFDFGSNKHSIPLIIDLDKYAKENKLCIKVSAVDMSISFTVTAHKSWVEKNCPELLRKEWEDYCVYKYPYPFLNDRVSAVVEKPSKYGTCKETDKKRERLLYLLHRLFTNEEIENFKPHNICGCPSGESFLDWEEKNFGAIEVSEDTIWRVVNGEVIEEKITETQI